MINLIGEVVVNNKFGEGVIIDRNGEYLTVDFEKLNERKVIALRAFEKKIYRFKNEVTETEVLNEIEASQNAVKAAREKILEEDRIQIILGSKTNRETISKIGSELKPFQPMGTAAREIFEKCVKAFNWNNSQKGFFESRQSLYAPNVTANGWGCWFIGNSNLTETESKNWKNVISRDTETITETCKEDTDLFDTDDKAERVVFLKKPDNMYVFLGVYKCDLVDGKTRTRIYKRISNVYSEQEAIVLPLAA